MKRVFLRSAGQFTEVPQGETRENTIGFMRCSDRRFLLCGLTEWEAEWLKSKGVDTKFCVRAYNWHNNITNIFYVNPETGVWASVDSDHLNATDDVKFTTKTRYSELHVDLTDLAWKVFDISRMIN